MNDFFGIISFNHKCLVGKSFYNYNSKCPITIKNIKIHGDSLKNDSIKVIANIKPLDFTTFGKIDPIVIGVLTRDVLETDNIIIKCCRIYKFK